MIICTNVISIHALLAESDRYLVNTYHRIFGISIHALLAESDANSQQEKSNGREFLSTLSLRRATCYSLRHSAPGWHFYPRSPCGERQRAEHHANSQQEFLSTLSLRRATSQQPGGTTRTTYFYPRSPCGERPNANLRRHRSNHNFYPRSPCGERQTQKPKPTRQNQFLSTLSLRRATGPEANSRTGQQISIHALLAESDLLTLSMAVIPILFLSTLSLRRATGKGSRRGVLSSISIHALLAESDRCLKC